MEIAFNDLTPNQAYHLMTQAIIPRPIAWALTENSGNGQPPSYNLAPFSWFNAVCSNPPLLMLSIGHKPDGSEKDTLVNIRHSELAVIHIASAEHLPPLNQSAATLPYGTSEVEAEQLALAPMSHFALPRLRHARIAFACTLDHVHEVGAGPQALVFMGIEKIYISDQLVRRDDGSDRLYIDPEKLDPVARLGGSDYALLGQRHSLKRPA